MNDVFHYPPDLFDLLVQTILERIIEFDNKIFFVEMKWKNESIGSSDIYTHLGRNLNKKIDAATIEKNPYEKNINI